MFSRCLLMAILATAFNFAAAQTTCQAPQNTYTSTPGSRAVSVSWSYSGGSPTYQVQYRYAGQVGWTRFVSSSTSTTLSNLAPRTSYEWRVRTICAAGDTSAFTTPVSFSTVCAVPQSLYNIAVSYESAQLSWSSNSNESPTYQVQYRAVGAAEWTSKPLQTYGSLTNLTNDTDYQWRVRSICSPGDTSAFSAIASFRTVCYTPSGLNTTELTYQSARLNWYGGTSGAAYEVYWRAVGAADWTSVTSASTSLTLKGLANNASYEWKVRTNCSATAQSVFTSPVTFRTQCFVPYSPITSIINTDAAELRWTNSVGTYTADIRWRAAGSANWTDVPGLNSADYGLTGLTPNTTYEWQVRAACGAADKSAYTASTLFTTSCNVPTNPNSQAIGSNQATITWNAKAPVNLQYRSAGSADWQLVSAVASPYSITGLATNVVYEWRVAAACASGITSDYTSTQLFTTSCSAPQYPGNQSTSTNDGMVCVWYGAETGAVYELQWREAGATTWTVVPGITQSQYTVSPVVLNTTYVWRVRRSCTATDFSDFAETRTYTPTCQANYSTSSPYRRTATSVDLIWYGSESTGTYEIQWRPSGATSWSTVSGLTTSPYRLVGLTAGTTYEWRMRKMCTPAIGTDYSYTNQFSLPCNQPTSFYTSGTAATTASVGWVNSYSYPPYDLNYRVLGQTSWVSLTDLSTSSVSLTGLSPNTTYEWQVRSNCSATGAPPAFGATQTFATQCGGSLTNVGLVSVLANEVKVAWLGQEGPLSYEMQYREIGAANWNTKLVPADEIARSSGIGPGSKQYTFYGLTVNRTYEWRVRSVCEAEIYSPYVNGPSFTPRCAYPVVSYILQMLGNSRFSVSWDNPTLSDTYDVQWRALGSANWLSEQGISGPSYSFTELLTGTTYEYRVQRVCSATASSGFTGTYQQTMRCLEPGFVTTQTLSRTSIGVKWSYFESATAEELRQLTFSIQYKVSGTDAWTTVSVPANTAITQYPSLAFALTGLTIGTSYVIQLRAECSPQVVSAYTSPAYHTLSCAVPGSLQAIVGTTSARLLWNSFSENPAQIQWRQAGTTTWTPITATATSNGSGTYLLTGLTNGSSYEWRMANGCGNGSLSDFTAIQFFQTGCALATASNLNVVPGATSATVSWSYYPAFLGTSTVQYRPLNTVAWTDVNAPPSNALSLTGLQVNTTYEWRIRSVCEEGQWTVSSTMIFQTACRSANYGYTSNVQANGASVYWAAGTNAPVSIQWRPVNTTTWVEATAISNPYQFTGLTPATTYEVRFQTVCTGTIRSDFSAVSRFTTVTTSTPAGSVTVDSTGLTVARFRINNMVGAYMLQLRVAGTTTWTNTGLLTAGTYLVQNLTPGTTYDVRLAQTGAGGALVYSSFVQFNTNCPQPTDLGVDHLTAGSAVLRWYVLRSTAVSVQWRAGGSASWNTGPIVTTNTYSLTGLTQNTTYEWRVAPVCGTKQYTPLASFHTLTPCQAPMYPESRNVTASSALLTWSNAPALARFTVRYRVAGTTGWTLQTGLANSPLLLTGLTNSTTYDWAVAVECAASGTLTFSNSARFTTRCVTPNAGNYSVQVTPTQAMLAWQNGGPDFVVRWRVQHTTTWTTAPVSATILLLNGLTPNTTYEWQVRAACAEDVAASYSTGITFTTQCNSSSVFGQAATLLSTNAVLLNWSPANYSLAPNLATYTVGWRVQGATNWTTTSGVLPPYTLPGLTTNTTYEWQVRADCRTEFDSPLAFQTVCSLPANHRVAQQTNTTAQLVWSDAFGGAPYELQWRVAGTDAWNTVSGIAGTTYTLTGLTNNSDYDWQVRGLCGAGYQTTAAFRLTSASQTSVYTVKTGSWSDSSVWSCTCVPTATDAVLLRHAVTVPASYTGFAKQIFYEGAGQLKMSAASVLKPKP